MSQRIIGRWRSFIIMTNDDDVLLREDDILNIRRIDLRTGRILEATIRGNEATGSITPHGAFFDITIDVPEESVRYEGLLSQDTLHLVEKNVLTITGRVFAPNELRREGVESSLQSAIARVRADDQEQATWMATKQG